MQWLVVLPMLALWLAFEWANHINTESDWDYLLPEGDE